MSPRSSRAKTDTGKLIQILERLPFSQDDKKTWIEMLQQDGMSEYLAKEIQTHLTAIQSVAENQVLQVKQDIAAVNKFIQTWRLNQNLSQFRKR